MLPQLLQSLSALQNPDKAKILQSFFKTGVGEYGEGDNFLGITVPVLRNEAKKFLDLPKNDLEKLLNSDIHEHRFIALTIIRINFEKEKNEEIKKELFEFSLKNVKSINNWDLVDTFVPYVFGEYLFEKDKTILYEFTKSSNLWERRISIISTFYFIKNNYFEDTLKICEILLYDKHDLIQKACGWMLREVGKKDEVTLINFLDKHYKTMPRTMLRYAIERLDIEKKKYYMNRN